MQTIEERLVIRDAEENIQNYTPHEAVTYVSTDTGAVYDGTGSSWTPASRGFDTAAANSVETAKLTATESITYPDGTEVTGSPSGDSGSGQSPPVRIHALYNSDTSFGPSDSLAVGSRSAPGYALGHYWSTDGNGAGANDVEWRYYWDEESTPSYVLTGTGDGFNSQSGTQDTRGRNWGEHEHGDQQPNIVYHNWETPAPYDAVDAEVFNSYSQSFSDVRGLALVAEEVDVDPLGTWRRRSTGGADTPVSEGTRSTFVDIDGRGRFCGMFIDIDDQDVLDVDVTLTLDGIDVFSMNTRDLVDLFCGYENVGGALFGFGEYDDAAVQTSFFLTPMDMGLFSDFETTMDLVLDNRSGAEITVDWSCLWDESI